MSKLKDNIKHGYFLSVSEWWGLSDNPGSRGLFVYPNGEYIKKSIYFKHPENDTQTEGSLDEKTLADLREFINQNINHSKSNMIFDYGCDIELISAGKKITIENDTKLFGEIIMLLPFKDSF